MPDHTLRKFTINDNSDTDYELLQFAMDYNLNLSIKDYVIFFGSLSGLVILLNLIRKGLL